MPDNISTRLPANYFLNRGGEMGKLTRDFDWSSTALGKPEQWPQSLKTTLSIILNSKFPMFLFWGAALNCFYNDAYRPSLGNDGKHPGILGKPGAEAWPEIWEFIEPVINDVMVGKEAVKFEDQLLPIYRNGKKENVYWTFSYSPVTDETGKIAGVFVTCTETTQQVISTKALLEANAAKELAQAEAERQRDRLYRFFMQAPAGICILDGPEMVFELVNPGYQLLFLGRKLTGLPLLKALPELQATPVEEILKNIYATGETFEANGFLIPLAQKIGGPVEDRYFNLVYQARLNSENKVDGILVLAFEVTEQIGDQKRTHLLNDKLSAINEVMTSSNEEFAAMNEKLTVSNNELVSIQRELQLQTAEKQIAFDRLNSSEQNIRNMVRQAPVGMCIIQGDPLYVIEINDSFLKLIGKSMEELKSKPYWEVNAEAAPYYKPITDQVITTGETYHTKEHEILLIRKGIKEIVHVNFVYEPLKDSKGKTYAIMIVAIDITDQVNSRKKVERAEESLRMAVEAAELGSFYINAKDRIFISSPRFKEFFGYGSDEEIPYEAAIKKIHPDHRHAATKIFEAAFTTGIKFDMEYPVIAYDDNKIRWVRCLGTVQHDSDGLGTYLTGVLHDISEQKQNEERKNAFIGMVSHEMKTPLTSLNGYLQILQLRAKKDDDQFTKSIFHKAGLQIKKLTGLINGFLNVSRFEAGKIYIDKRKFDMAMLINEAAEESSTTINSHKVIFAPVETTIVVADRDKIGQVITNLISNAVKYSPIGSTINVACITVNDEAQVSVKDTGIGVAPQDKDKLFDRYYRVEANHMNSIGGFGIGLYLCAEIIKRHDGNIWVQSELGKGSIFSFTIPIAQ